MTELTTQQVAELIELLDERQKTLESLAQDHVAQLRNSSQPDGTSLPGDIADLADIDLVRAQENAAVGRDVRELRQIQEARDRIDTGKAGICIDCAEEIGFDRLQVQPTAARCVICQDAYEHVHLIAPDATSGAIESP